MDADIWVDGSSEDESQDQDDNEDDQQDDNEDNNANPDGEERVTRRMVTERGIDPQGIPWDRLETSRDEYRKNRLRDYPHYENLQQDQRNITPAPLDLQAEPQILATKNGQYFDFMSNERSVRSSIVHFQLRNLVWATSCHDVYVTHGNEIVHYSVCVAGGFYGDIVCVRVPHDLRRNPGRREGCGEMVYSERITRHDNAITNAILLKRSPSGALQAVISNNDCAVRMRDVEANMRQTLQLNLDWPVNFTAVEEEGKLACVVGDAPEALIVDLSTGHVIEKCEGHRHYSFAADFHPGGYIFATGNQDKTCKVWDKRTWRCLATLPAYLGAVRSIRFTGDGSLMAMAEPADFVHIFDVRSNMQQKQEIDLFGEIAGIALCPESEALFIGVADRTYGSMLHFRRPHPHMADVLSF